ncbi:MAG TPA: GMC oxidoreductase [Acidimicrobiia bacterium]|nr:GMC oxidoreductase [Acidimicrobiia bacterium]
MLNDARHLPADALITAEACVIGAGPAGIAAASELAQRGVHVVLVEAGGLREERNSTETYRGVIDGEDGLNSGRRDVHPPLETLRQRAFGGTTWSWGGRCAPLGELDFDTRPHLALSGWPISRAELLPFYRRAHEYLELGHFEYSTREAMPSGPPFLLADCRESDLLCDTDLFRYSPPTNFGRAYRPFVGREPAIRAYHHANVLRLEVDPDGKAVTGAVIASQPGRLARVQASEYIIATGGLETARLLLVSGRSAGKPVGSGYGWVGKGYMTHLDGMVGRVGFRSDAPRAAYAYERSRDGVFCRRILRLPDRVQEERGLLNLGSVMYFPEPRHPSHGDSVLSGFALTKELLNRAGLGARTKRNRLPDRQPFPAGAHLLNIARNPLPLLAFGPRWASARWRGDRRLPSFLRRSAVNQYRLLFSAEQSPNRESGVALADDRDAFGVPRLKVSWRVSVADYDSVVGSLDLIANGFSRLGIGWMETPPTPEHLAAELGGGFVAGTHAMGLTRMSSSPDLGVVDRRCRVHGMSNLYVASSAVFPTGGFAPPTLTVVALAIRVADAIGRSRGRNIRTNTAVGSTEPDS